VKQVLAQFLAKRMQHGGDRFGLVLFGDKAYVQSGLTVDGLAVAQAFANAASYPFQLRALDL
jgi:hypothetical protein